LFLDRSWKEYYFKIAAKGGKCPDEEGASSEDDVVGIPLIHWNL
jgi:hypothetical protein